jgi:DNA-binding SARP family transcriptional activator
MRADPASIDAIHFQRLVIEAANLSAEHRPADACDVLRSALGLWRGPALADASGSFVEATRARLEDQRLTAVEDLIDLELARGRHDRVIVEFSQLIDAHPLRERLCGLMMRALCSAGRQVDALRTYRVLRKGLAEEHGLDPSTALRDIERTILQGNLIGIQSRSRMGHRPYADAASAGAFTACGA